MVKETSIYRLHIKPFDITRNDGTKIAITRWGFLDLYYAKTKTDIGIQCETLTSPTLLIRDLTKPPGKLQKG